jgi:hypothetical protein
MDAAIGMQEKRVLQRQLKDHLFLIISANG